jgi:adenine-specific DNA-methyltransferase
VSGGGGSVKRMRGWSETPDDERSDWLVAAALALGAESVRGVSEAERQLARATATKVTRREAAGLCEAIRAGEDPLGTRFCMLRSPQERRLLGATYTPSSIVGAMLDWSIDAIRPVRIVDPGAGSGRFSVAAGRRFPHASVIAIEIDPLAALLARGHLAAAGLASRARVVLADYRSLTLDTVDGPTLFVGNPPYVRHHQIEPRWKAWLTATARARKLVASQLAGLHVHFFLATLQHAVKGDVGAFITSSEWLDTNYGRLVRSLLLDGLGGRAIHMIEPSALPFEDATTTGAITCFEVGTSPRTVRLRRVARVEDLGRLDGGRPVARERLSEAHRWSPLIGAAQKVPDGYIELGEICRVHRGAVTGSNAVWVRDADEGDLPRSVLFHSITRARELFAAGPSLRVAHGLKLVVDIPPDLDVFQQDEIRQIERFLRVAKRRGAADAYVARNRRAWWSIGLRSAAPILATYMARRPPAFVRNLAGARHINIAHGLYPRIELSDAQLDRLSAALCTSVTVAQGRTYAGGLTKFEPREMERLLVPAPDRLLAA